MAKVMVPAGVKAGAMKNNVSNKTVSQSGTGGSSARQSTAIGSGSRPTPSRIKIDSSNPVSSQRIRPSNPTEGTKYKG